MAIPPLAFRIVVSLPQKLMKKIITGYNKQDNLYYDEETCQCIVRPDNYTMYEGKLSYRVFTSVGFKLEVIHNIASPTAMKLLKEY